MFDDFRPCEKTRILRGHKLYSRLLCFFCLHKNKRHGLVRINLFLFLVCRVHENRTSLRKGRCVQLWRDIAWAFDWAKSSRWFFRGGAHESSYLGKKHSSSKELLCFQYETLDSLMGYTPNQRCSTLKYYFHIYIWGVNTNQIYEWQLLDYIHVVGTSNTINNLYETYLEVFSFKYFKKRHILNLILMIFVLAG